MARAWMLVILVAGCSRSANDRRTSSIDTCAELDHVLTERRRCEPLLDFELKLLRQGRATMGSGELSGSPRHSCALRLRILGQLDSPCTKPYRPELRAAIDVEVARRTSIPPTGDPRADVHARVLSSLRDRMCTCKDAVCRHAVEQELAGSDVLSPLFRSRNAAYGQAVVRVVEELAGCIMLLDAGTS